MSLVPCSLVTAVTVGTTPQGANVERVRTREERREGSTTMNCHAFRAAQAGARKTPAGSGSSRHSRVGRSAEAEWRQPRWSAMLTELGRASAGPMALSQGPLNSPVISRALLLREHRES